MALRYWPILVLSAVSLSPPSAHAQTGGGGEFIAGSKGVPFSAEFVSTTVRTLADGTHITEQQKRFEARDSQGRTRTEVYLPDSVAKLRNQPTDQPRFITIVDPVSGLHIQLNPQPRLATINSWVPPDRPPQRVAATQPAQPMQSSPRVQSSKENLGGKTIDGVYAEGTRAIQVDPAGALGNDRDITVVSERWISPELGVEVLSRISDPRNGETTTEVRNLNRAEPDPALFLVPADYKMRRQ